MENSEIQIKKLNKDNEDYQDNIFHEFVGKEKGVTKNSKSSVSRRLENVHRAGRLRQQVMVSNVDNFCVRCILKIQHFPSYHVADTNVNLLVDLFTSPTAGRRKIWTYPFHLQ